MEMMKNQIAICYLTSLRKDGVNHLYAQTLLILPEKNSGLHRHSTDGPYCANITLCSVSMHYKNWVALVSMLLKTQTQQARNV